MSSSRKKKKSIQNAESEVDQLLKAAEDHLLLNLKTNTHTKSSPITNNPFSSSSSLHPDLDRRFNALKSTPSKSDNIEDLDGRFSALKTSLGHQENSAIESSNVDEESDDDDDDDGDGVSKKEVEKLMQWAMDAARLDPVSKSDDEEKDLEEEEDDDEDLEEEEKKKKGDEKAKGKPKKWYFF